MKRELRFLSSKNGREHMRVERINLCLIFFFYQEHNKTQSERWIQYMINLKDERDIKNISINFINIYYI